MAQEPNEPTFREAYRRKVTQIQEDMMRDALKLIPAFFQQKKTAQELAADLDAPNVHYRHVMQESLIMLATDQALQMAQRAKAITLEQLKEMEAQQLRMFEAYNYGDGAAARVESLTRYLEDIFVIACKASQQSTKEQVIVLLGQVEQVVVTALGQPVHDWRPQSPEQEKG